MHGRSKRCNEVELFRTPTEYRDDFGFDEGPRATPCISDGKVYTFGVEGMLTCLDLSDGKKVWQVDTKDQFHQGKGFFGMAGCSPIAEGGNVLLDIGGGGAEQGLSHLTKAQEKSPGNPPMTKPAYASPVVATIHDKRLRAFFFTRAGPRRC